MPDLATWPSPNAASAKAPRLADLAAPIIVPHRMGGSAVAPDNVLASAEAAVARGYRCIDGGDWKLGADGTLLCSHEAITATYLQGTAGVAANIADHTAHSMRSVRADPARYMKAPGWAGTFPVPTLDDVMAFATRNGVAITPELKDYTPASAQQLIDAILRHGLRASALFSSFVQAAVTQAHAAGLITCQIAQDESLSVASIVASGADYFAYAAPVSDGYLSALRAAGVKIAAATLNRQSDLAAEQARGPVAMVFSDDPDLVRGLTTPADTFKSLTWPGGVRASHTSSGYRGQIITPGRWQLDSGGYMTMHGWGRMRSMLEFDMTWDTLPTDLNAFAMFAFGCVDDKSFSDSTTNQSAAYAFIHRANGGILGIGRSADTGGGTSVSTSLANTLAGVAPTLGQTIRYRIEYDPPGFAGSIRFYRLDTNANRFITDLALRGPFFHFGHSAGFQASFSNIVPT